MTASPLALPRVSKAHVAALRARHAPRAALTFANGKQRLSVEETAKGGYGPNQTCITLSWGKHVLQLRCPIDLPKDALLRLEPNLDVVTMPPNLAGFLLEAACLPAILAAERISGRDISIASLEADADDLVADGLRLVLDDGGRRWRIHVSSNSTTDDVVGAILDFWPVAPRSMSRFPLPAALRLGTTWLTLAALASLRSDDAVLLQTRCAEGGVLVLAEAWIATAERHGTAWRLSEAPRPARFKHEMEWTMRDESEPGNRAEPIIDPDELPVQVAFDVGRLDITLGELRRLAAGSVLEVNRSAEDLVRISANGRLIGHGALVDVEGTVGVRIVRLFDHG